MFALKLTCRAHLSPGSQLHFVNCFLFGPLYSQFHLVLSPVTIRQRAVFSLCCGARRVESDRSALVWRRDPRPSCHHSWSDERRPSMFGVVCCSRSQSNPHSLALLPCHQTFPSLQFTTTSPSWARGGPAHGRVRCVCRPASRYLWHTIRHRSTARRSAQCRLISRNLPHFQRPD